MESTPRWPTTGTGLTTQSNRTEEESFATRGNFAVVKKNGTIHPFRCVGGGGGGTMGENHSFWLLKRFLI